MKSKPIIGAIAAVVVPLQLFIADAYALHGESPPPAWDAVVTQIHELIAAKPRDAFTKALHDAYRQRQAHPVWVARADSQSRLEALRERLLNAGEDGLNPSHYPAPARPGAHPSAESLARLELRASASYVRFVLDLHAVSPDARSMRHRRSELPEGIDAARVIARAAAARDVAQHLRQVGPDSHIYTGLKKALARYRGLRLAGGWPQVPRSRKIKPGGTGPSIIALRERLFASGDLLDEDTTSPVYDDTLLAAVHQFQQRHGLKVDGEVGPSTRKMLNRSVDQRIDQILINMERARWLPRDLGERFVMVNVPGYRLQVREGDAVALDMGVIVGRRHRRTPVYSGELTRLEFNPYWGVPDSIARKDILPKLKENPGYMRGLRIYQKGQGYPYTELDRYSIDWTSMSEAEPFPFYLRQDPGPSNALGRVKFLFDNPFDVYLHDTPSQRLFNRTNRAFSSGCVRLEQPLQMAEFLLSRQPGWDRTRIDGALARGKNVRLELETPVPVHLVYHTAWLADDGRVNFRADIYGRDRALSTFVAKSRFRPDLDVPVQAALEVSRATVDM